MIERPSLLLLSQHPTKHAPQVTIHRTSVVVHSLVCYFLVSSVTALVIRVVTSSGVVVMFPLFLGLQKVVAALSDLANIGLGESFPAMRDQASTLALLAHAYPWIGVRLHGIRAQGRSIVPVVAGHLIYLVIYALLYEAAQFFLWVAFYSKSAPDGFPVLIFAICLVVEIFSQFFVRHATTIRFFPRYFCLYFLALHAYFLSTPYGFYLPALIAFGAASGNLCLYFLLNYEVPALTRGDMHDQRPRAYFNATAAPVWRYGIPPEFTVFMPLSSRVPTSVHEVVLENGGNPGLRRDGDGFTVEQWPGILGRARGGGQGQGQGGGGGGEGGGDGGGARGVRGGRGRGAPPLQRAREEKEGDEDHRGDASAATAAAATSSTPGQEAGGSMRWHRGGSRVCSDGSEDNDYGDYSEDDDYGDDSEDDGADSEDDGDDSEDDGDDDIQIDVR